MMSDSTHPLLGIWAIDDSDENAIARYGRTSMEFRSDGTLVHAIHGDESDQIMLLTFRVEGNVLITDQPSSPKVDRSDFMFCDDGRLVLVHDGVSSFYRRCGEPPDSGGAGEELP
jgi:hypothetical protein